MVESRKLRCEPARNDGRVKTRNTDVMRLQKTLHRLSFFILLHQDVLNFISEYSIGMSSFYNSYIFVSKYDSTGCPARNLSRFQDYEVH